MSKQIHTTDDQKFVLIPSLRQASSTPTSLATARAVSHGVSRGSSDLASDMLSLDVKSRVALAAASSQDDRDAQRLEQAQEATSQGRKLTLANLPMRKLCASLRLPRAPRFFAKGIRYSTILYWGFNAKVSTVAVKYLINLNGANAISWATIVSNSAELAGFANLFNEIFVHRIKLMFRPINKNSANSSSSTAAAGSPGDLNTCLAVISYLPHNATGVSDASNAYLVLMEQNANAVVNLGNDFDFVAQNQEKFSWDGPLMDESTAVAAQGWVQIGLVVSKLGGAFQMGTPYASGAAVGLGTLLEGGVFGDLVAECTVSFRNRV